MNNSKVVLTLLVSSYYSKRYFENLDKNSHAIPLVSTVPPLPGNIPQSSSYGLWSAAYNVTRVTSVLLAQLVNDWVE